MSNISETSHAPEDAGSRRSRRVRLALAALLVLPVFMYVSIMYKIINFGP